MKALGNEWAPLLASFAENEHVYLIVFFQSTSQDAGIKVLSDIGVLTPLLTEQVRELRSRGVQGPTVNDRSE